MFNWQNNLQLENKKLRSHDTKDFPHPTDLSQRIKIQSSGLLHAYTDKGWEDIKTELPDYNFPEGREITAPADKHFMMDLPAWGDARVEENGKVVRVYDKKGVSIYRFRNPIVIEKGKAPFEVIDERGGKIKDTFDEKEKIEPDQKVIRKPEVDEATFEVLENKLYFKLPTNLKNTYPLQAYDDTDTASTNNEDNWLRLDIPDTNYSAGTTLPIYSYFSGSLNARHPIFDWTLSSGSGTISSIRLYLYVQVVTVAGGTIQVHELTQAVVAGQSTWNSYSTGNSWATPGGDYSATVVDSALQTSVFPVDTWGYLDLGTGATNPIAGLTWGSNVDLLLRYTDESGTAPNQDVQFRSKENASNNPYLEITYTPAATFIPTITIF